MTILEEWMLILFYIVGGMSPTLFAYLYYKWKDRQEERQRFGYIQKHWYAYVDYRAYELYDRSTKEDSLGFRLIMKKKTMYEKLKDKLK